MRLLFMEKSIVFHHLSVLSVTVIVFGNRIGDLSSHPGQNLAVILLRKS